MSTKGMALMLDATGVDAGVASPCARDSGSAAFLVATGLNSILRKHGSVLSTRACLLHRPLETGRGILQRRITLALPRRRGPLERVKSRGVFQGAARSSSVCAERAREI